MKKLSLTALFVVLMSSAVYAQLGLSGEIAWASPQSAATQGRFRSAADDFIRPDSYKSAGIGNWFAMTSFRTPTELSLGFGKTINELYFGLYYGGTGLANLTRVEYTETTVGWVDGKDKSGVRSYDPIPTLGTPKNRVALLVGVADMGFRLSFYSTHQSFSDEDFWDDSGTGTAYKSYESAKGILEPEIVWSLSKDLTSSGLRPWVAFKMSFYRDYSKSDIYGYDGTKIINTNIVIGHSENKFTPSFNIGLGGFTLYNQNSFKFSTDLEYGFSIDTYNNEYSYVDANNKYQIGTIKGTNKTSGLEERGFNSHTITPYLLGAWSGEKLGLKFRLGLPLKFTSEEIVPMDFSTDLNKANKGTLVKNGDETSTFTTNFTPKLELAAQWWIVPKLALNVGGAISVGLTSTTEEGKENDSDGKKVPSSDYKSVTTTYGATSNQLTLGATFKPTDYLTFEAASGISNTSSNDVSVFQSNSNGLLYFYNILVSLKF